MSLQLIEFENRQIEPFPPGKNVRVTITGLALCKFSAAPPIFRVLRHVEHHEFLMRIIQADSNGTIQKSITVKIEPDQDVEISGTTMAVAGGHDLSRLVKMRSFLHGNRPLEDRPLPTPPPSLLKVNNCAFYTHKLTDDRFYFEDENGRQTQPKQYCQVLGGYMSYSGNLIISPENSFPFTLPLNGFLYEIQFNNSCDTTPSCKDEEDFSCYYQVVQERGNPNKKFKMKKEPKTKGKGKESIGTGACLPPCEDC
jgi:hypothetical protein